MNGGYELYNVYANKELMILIALWIITFIGLIIIRELRIKPDEFITKNY